MLGKMSLFFIDWRGLLRPLAAWLAGLAGLALTPAGCRPVPAGNLDFDQALAKRLGSINYAVAYSVIYRWIVNNEQRGRGRYYRDGRWWTIGTDTQFAALYARCMSRNTWARAVDKLAAAGLIECRQIDGLPAYALTSMVGSDVQDGQERVQDAREGVQRERGSVHGEHHKQEESKQKSPAPIRVATAAPARAREEAAVVAQPLELIGEVIEGDSVEPGQEGADVSPVEAMLADKPTPQPPPPVPPPPSPDEVATAGDEDAETKPDEGEWHWEPGDWAAFFSGATAAEIAALLPDATAKDQARRWRQYAEREGSRITNPAGFVVTMLRRGLPGPLTPAEREREKWARAAALYGDAIEQ